MATIVIAWRLFRKSDPFGVIWAFASLGLALLSLLVVSAGGGAQIGFDIGTCVSPVRQ